jgi:hypothetical protein
MTLNATLIDPYGRSAEDRKAMQDLKDQVNREVAENWEDESYRHELAAELTETIIEGFTHTNLLGLMAEVENAGFTDRVFVKEVRGLRAFWVARGGYIEASQMRAQVMELPRDTIGFHVFEFEDKLKTNFAETQATLINLGIQRLDAEVNLRVLRLFQAAVPDGSDYYLSNGGLDLDQLNTALREVRDETKSFEVAIIGRSTMTEQINDALLGANNGSGYIPETNEQLVRRGVLGTYRGARIITLINYKDDQDISFFPANELYVVARDASKFAFWGGLLSKDFVEQDNWYWHYLARRDFGGVVHRPANLRRIVDTDIDA